MNTTNSSKPKEFILEVTQEEYDAAMAKGWNDDDTHKPGKYRYRRATRFAKREDLLPQNTTVDIYLSVTLDILQHFEKRAEKLNSTSYQELMKAELSAAMERDQRVQEDAANKAVEILLSNEKFIAAVAEKVAAQTAELKAA